MNPLTCAACGGQAIPPPLDSVAAADAATGCDDCRSRHLFRRLPLLCLTGPSGTGKSTVARLLTPSLADRVVVLEQDVLWRSGLRERWAFRSTWLRLAAMIQQSGRPVLLCGTVVPAELEGLPERALFTHISYYSLICDGAELARRLRARPAWREWSEPRITETLEFNDWLTSAAATLDPPVELLDTTDRSVELTADHVRTWALREVAVSTPHPSPG